MPIASCRLHICICPCHGRALEQSHVRGPQGRGGPNWGLGPWGTSEWPWGGSEGRAHAEGHGPGPGSKPGHKQIQVCKRSWKIRNRQKAMGKRQDSTHTFLRKCRKSKKCRQSRKLQLTLLGMNIIHIIQILSVAYRLLTISYCSLITA